MLAAARVLFVMMRDRGSAVYGRWIAAGGKGGEGGNEEDGEGPMEEGSWPGSRMYPWLSLAKRESEISLM